ncbi:helix-turn-helix domain-containing protein [Paenibacillus zeisoli]|uniref:Helix-turn-helix domain-containing protein n=1 Tax=Paenibacillus zeisoli TaxID=2496267 RepID=A0A3S1B6K3_9BACL|nr:helix-turn-helix domain-containing protein [Paenibacillus zeisoli]RUT29779.1 helix-turn-helix domain-containing protein [Paenibacillus zeisoli]
MSDLGQQLKEARLQRGLSLDDVQEMTKIRKRYLEAIEAGDYKVLPGSFYVRAFIKTYAEAVGVDSDGLLEEHRKDVPVSEPEPTMEPVIQKRRSSHAATERNSKWLSTTLMWSFAALIVIVIYIVVSSNRGSDSTKTPDPTPVTDTKTPVTTTPSKTETVTPPAQGGDSNTGGGQAGTDSQGQAATPGTGTTTEPNAGTNGTQTGTGTDTTGTENASGSDSATVTPDGKKGSTTKFKVTSSGTAPVKVEIKASGKSWVEVRKGTSRGEKLFYQNIEDGETQSYDLGPEGLYIKSGNSNNTVITVGGKVVTDGKNTTKIQLNLDDGTSAQSTNESGAGDSTTSTENSTSGTESTTTESDTSGTSTN